MERIDPEAVTLPGCRPNPATRVTWLSSPSAPSVTNRRQTDHHYRWALSAFGTASAAALVGEATRSTPDPCTISPACWSPVGGAVVGGARIALSRGLCRSGSSRRSASAASPVVSYTWAMLRDVIDDPAFVLTVTTRCGCSSVRHADRIVAAGHRDVRAAPVVEFFATTDGQAVLANVSGAKVGSKGPPLPGGGEIELAAYDADPTSSSKTTADSSRSPGRPDRVLLASPRGPVDPTASVKRGVFAPADTWVSTESLFRRDADGDYWLVGNRNAPIATARGVTFRNPSPGGQPDHQSIWP